MQQFNIFRIVLATCLVAVSLVTLGFIQVTDITPVESILNFKRATTIVRPTFTESKSAQLSVNVESLNSNPKKPMSRTARNAQLSYIGFSNPMTVEQWVDFVTNINSKTSITTVINGGFNQASVQKMYNDPLVGGVAKAVTIGLVMAIISPIVMLLFCCCRCCCNMCGGKQVSLQGYTPQQVKISLAIFAVLSILNLTFASLMVSFYQDVGVTIDVFQIAANAFVTDSQSFVDSTLVAAQETPDLLVETVFDVLATVSDNNGTLVLEIQSTIGSLVVNVTDQIEVVQSVLDNTVLLLNQTNSLIGSIETQSSTLPASFNKLADKIDALQFVTFNGSQFAVPNFPSTAAMRNISLPNFSQLPNLTDFMNQLKSLPNLNDQAATLTGLYNSYVNNMSAQVIPLVNGSIYQFRDQAKASLSSTNSLQVAFNESIVPIQKEINQYASQAKTYQSTYGLYFFLAQAVILIIAIIVSAMGAIMKRPPFMLTFPCATFSLISLIWLQFVLFYLVAIPFNVACNSKDAVMNHEYTSASFTNATIPYVGNASFAVNPQLFISSCRNGKNIFDATFNKAGQAPVDILVNVLNENLIIVDDMVDAYNLSSLLDAFDPSVALDQINAEDFSSVNLTSFSFPPLTISSDINQTLITIDSTLLTLTPVQFNSERGKNGTMNMKLDQFNAFASSFNASWVNYTYWYLVVNRVDTNQWQWNPQEVTGSAQPQDYADLAQDYYDAFWRIVFIRQASLAIDKIAANVTAIAQEIKAIQTQQLDVIQDKYKDVKETVATLQTLVNQIVTLINVVKAVVPALKSAITRLANFFPNYLKDLARVAIQAVLNNVLVRDPSSKFGSCQALASDFQYAVDGTCTTLTDTLAGLWFTFMLLGIFTSAGFVATIIAKKRVLFLQRGNAVDDMFASKSSSFDKLDSNKAPLRERDNIQASAPFQEYDVQDGMKQQNNVELEELPLQQVSQDDLFRNESSDRAPDYE